MRPCRVDVAFVPVFCDQFGMFAPQRDTTCRVPFPHGHHYNPRLYLHSAFVAFVYCESQRVVSGRLFGHACKAGVPWFYGRRIDYGRAYACLEKHCVYACGFQFVEHKCEFLFLFFRRAGVDGLVFRPVQSSKGGEPYGSYFYFG